MSMRWQSLHALYQQQSALQMLLQGGEKDLEKAD